MGYLLTGRRMSAHDALRLGLVNEVTSPDDLDERVAGWADELVLSAPLSVRAVKEAVLRSLDMPLEDAFTTKFTWEEKRRYSADAVEGPKAFAEKRSPQWRGN
jgi:enoyl-CoA hydratase/carnithine racemase